MRLKSSWLRQFKASWRIVEPQGFFDATLVGENKNKRNCCVSPVCVLPVRNLCKLPQQGLCTQAQSRGFSKICCVTLLRYTGTFSPQFHAFGYEGRAGMLGTLLTPHHTLDCQRVWEDEMLTMAALIGHNLPGLARRVDMITKNLSSSKLFKISHRFESHPVCLLSLRPTVFDSAYCYAELALLFALVQSIR